MSAPRACSLGSWSETGHRGGAARLPLSFRDRRPSGPTYRQAPEGCCGTPVGGPGSRRPVDPALRRAGTGRRDPVCALRAAGDRTGRARHPWRAGRDWSACCGGCHRSTAWCEQTKARRPTGTARSWTCPPFGATTRTRFPGPPLTCPPCGAHVPCWAPLTPGSCGSASCGQATRSSFETACAPAACRTSRRSSSCQARSSLASRWDRVPES